jgi:two-component system, NtrC family, nitrogen regulation response regulator NtrX
MTSVLYLGCPASERADAENLLSAGQVSVVWADDLACALDALHRRDMPVLLDLSRGAAALQLAHDLRIHRASTLMFAVVDERRPDLTTEAVLAGMADVFARPLGGRRVASAIEREQRHGSRDGNGAASHGVDDGLYSQSLAMREVMTAIADAATKRAGVLIRGEEGTGRQIVARAIHVRQHFSPSTFVTVNCAAYDTEELDAALFGTAARSQGYGDAAASRGLARVSREGRLHEAIGGTIYMQNVAEAPTRVQARLARVLRDREVLLVETGEPIAFAVRPMAGVDPTFDRAVQEGRVRDDLFRRLAVTRIDMPPLRERRDDIAALTNYFLRDICAQLRVPPKTVSRAALSLISALPWPGNGVELRMLLESVVHGLQGGRGIGLEDLLAHVRLDGGSVGLAAHAGTLKQARARFEREYIATILEQHHGRISDAAKALGIQRTNLYRKMRSLRVSQRRESS